MKKIFIIMLIIISLIIMSIYFIKTITINQKQDIEEKYDYIKIKETISEEDKVGAKTKLIFRTYYTKCSHIKEEEQENIKELINLTKDELKKIYSEWKIEKFNSDEIVLIKDIDEFCGEHYVLRNDNNYVVVYSINENGDEKKYLSTEISTFYLPETDQINLRDGIRIYSKEKLIEILQDFE